MGRHITVTVDCDWPAGCDVHAVEGDGRVVPRSIAINGKQAKEFLLCKPHLDELDELLLPLMQAGVKVEDTGSRKRSTSAGANGSGTSPSAAVAGPEGARDPDATIDCQVDGCTRTGTRGLHNRTGMAQHCIRTHGFTSLAAYEEIYGPVG